MDGDNSRSKFSIDLSYDSEDGVWSGTSKDIPGLFLEADSFTEFLCEAKDVITELLICGNGITINGPPSNASVREWIRRILRTTTFCEARRVCG